MAPSVSTAGSALESHGRVGRPPLSSGNSSVLSSVPRMHSSANGIVKGTNGASGGAGSNSEGNSRRIELEKLVVEFQQRLGENWDRYQSALCLFLLGKLSRQELSDELAVVLQDKLTTRMHNQLLLLNLANALRDSPTAGVSAVGFGGPLSKKQKRKTSSQYEKIKKDIMLLPPRERRRLKNLQRDSGKKQMVTSSLVMTRQELLPKVPLISKGSQGSPVSLNGVKGDSSSQTPSNDSRVNNTALWTHEIVQGISTLNALESYEMPELDTLKVKMTQIMREHGLTGGANDNVMKIMSLGLETHLKSVMESIVDVVNYREHLYASDELYETMARNNSTGSSSKPVERPRKKKKIHVTLEDVFDTLQQQPLIIDYGGPLLRLSHSLLRNDDDTDDELTYDLKLAEKWDKEEVIVKAKEEPVNGVIPSGSPSSTTQNSVQSPATSGQLSTVLTLLTLPVALPQTQGLSLPLSLTLTLSTALSNESTNSEFGTRSELRSLLKDILLSS